MAQRDQLGKYTLLEKIGVGGMAEVWLARATGPGGFAKGCVVKTVRAGVDEARFARMFMDEARLAGLLNHPNIVQIFDYGDDAGQAYIAMEFIQGRTLRALMKKCETRRITFPLDHAARVMTGVLEGLDHAHNQLDQDGVPLKIIHRDVSPENVMVTYAGGIKLVDFGIAKATLSTDRTRDGRAKGKLTYMAPEQLMGAPLDHRVDLYACGVVMYELCCGRHPFPIPSPEALARAILDDEAVHPQQLNPGLPDDLADIIIQCMQKDPDHRFASARDMQRRLETYLNSLTLSANAVKLDSLVSAIWSEEMAEDGARARRAAGASATAQVVPEGRIPGLLSDDSERDTVSEAQPSAVKEQQDALRNSEPTASGVRPQSPAAPRVEEPARMPPPPLATGESPLTTTDRRALERVFESQGSNPSIQVSTDGAGRSASLPSQAPASNGFDGSISSVTGPILKGGLWRVPRRVAIAALLTMFLVGGALSGASLWVLSFKAGQRQATPDLTPIARLTVTAETDCSIKVDDLSQGKAPLRRLDVAPGPHTVFLHCNKGDVRIKVQAVPGREIAVVVPPPLEGAPAGNTPPSTTVDDKEPPDEGYVMVVSKKQGTLYLDTKKLGDIPQKPLVVTPGAHSLRLVTKDGKEHQMKVDVARGKTATARFP